MITIAAVSSQVDDGHGGKQSLMSPVSPIPANAIAVVCDGTNYTIYQPGDIVPAQFQG